MKPKLLSLIALLFTVYTNAQCPFTLSDLQKAATLTEDGFDTYVLNKGYSLNPVKGDGTFDYKQYWCDNRRANGGVDQVSRISGNEIKPSVDFLTVDKRLYLNFKRDLAAKNYRFQYQKDQPIGNLTATYYYYSDGKYQVSYYSYYLKEDSKIRYVMTCYKL